MNNDFLKQLINLLNDYENFEEEKGLDVYNFKIQKNSILDFNKKDKQKAEYENKLLDHYEYVNQISVGYAGDSWEGKVIRKIKDTDYSITFRYDA